MSDDTHIYVKQYMECVFFTFFSFDGLIGELGDLLEHYSGYSSKEEKKLQKLQKEIAGLGALLQKELYNFLFTGYEGLILYYQTEGLEALRWLIAQIQASKSTHQTPSSREKELRRIKRAFIIKLSRNPQIQNISELILLPLWFFDDCAKEFEYERECMMLHRLMGGSVSEIAHMRNLGARVEVEDFDRFHEFFCRIAQEWERLGIIPPSF